jgi:hypothetical protein
VCRACNQWTRHTYHLREAAGRSAIRPACFPICQPASLPCLPNEPHCLAEPPGLLPPHCTLPFQLPTYLPTCPPRRPPAPPACWQAGAAKPISHTNRPSVAGRLCSLRPLAWACGGTAPGHVLSCRAGGRPGGARGQSGSRKSSRARFGRLGGQTPQAIRPVRVRVRAAACLSRRTRRSSAVSRCSIPANNPQSAAPPRRINEHGGLRRALHARRSGMPWLSNAADMGAAGCDQGGRSAAAGPFAGRPSRARRARGARWRAPRRDGPAPRVPLRPLAPGPPSARPWGSPALGHPPPS